MNYVYTEGEYDVGNSNGVNDHRVCTIKFQGPPGTTLSFDWSAFALQSDRILQPDREIEDSDF